MVWMCFLVRHFQLVWVPQHFFGVFPGLDVINQKFEEIPDVWNLLAFLHLSITDQLHLTWLHARRRIGRRRRVGRR